MNVGMSANFIYSQVRDHSQNLVDRWAKDARNTAATIKQNESASPSSVRALENQQRSQQKAENSILSQSQAYANSLRASRTKAKDASLEKKKLQYSYKKISSQIVRSKNSISARKAAAAARREVQRLKRLQNSGEYDEEEVQISIEHAKSMERIAKKKVAHLQQEEMIERGQGGATAALEEKEEQDQEKELSEEEMDEAMAAENVRAMENPDESEYFEEMQLEMSDMQDEMAYRMAELAQQMQAQIQEVQESNSDSMDEMMSDMMKMVADVMEEMDEVLDLDELANTMVAPDPNMSEDDLKMLKMKHRTKEMKDIAKADGDYLKAIMDKYEKKGVAGMGLSGATSSTPVFGAAPSIQGSPSPIKVTIPASYGGGGGGMSFDAFA